jgi:hypothetical protein
MTLLSCESTCVRCNVLRCPWVGTIGTASEERSEDSAKLKFRQIMFLYQRGSLCFFVHI